MNRRLTIAGVVATLGLVAVTGSLVYINLVKGEEYSKRAYSQQVKNQIISSKRGTIYDSKGLVLAQSISVDTISINPTEVKYSNDKAVEPEKIAQALSDIFGLT